MMTGALAPPVGDADAVAVDDVGVKVAPSDPDAGEVIVVGAMD